MKDRQPGAENLALAAIRTLNADLAGQSSGRRRSLSPRPLDGKKLSPYQTRTTTTQSPSSFSSGVESSPSTQASPGSQRSPDALVNKYHHLPILTTDFFNERPNTKTNERSLVPSQESPRPPCSPSYPQITIKHSSSPTRLPKETPGSLPTSSRSMPPITSRQGSQAHEEGQLRSREDDSRQKSRASRNNLPSNVLPSPASFPVQTVQNASKEVGGKEGRRSEKEVQRVRSRDKEAAMPQVSIVAEPSPMNDTSAPRTSVTTPLAAEADVNGPRQEQAATIDSSTFGNRELNLSPKHVNSSPSRKRLLHPPPSTSKPMEIVMKVERKTGSCRRTDSATSVLKMGSVALHPSPEEYDLSETDFRCLATAVRDNPTSKVVVGQFGDICKVYATRKKVQRLQELGGEEVLMHILRQNVNTPGMVGMVLDIIGELIFHDSLLVPFAAQSLPPVLNIDTILKDDGCVTAYLDFLNDICVNANPSVLKMLPEERILSDLEIILKTATRKHDTDRLDCIQSIKKHLSGDGYEDLTLEEVYNYLLGRNEAEDKGLFILRDRVMRRLSYFIVKRTTEYGVNMQIEDGVCGFLGKEFMYGCLCFQVLAQVPENLPVLRGLHVPQVLLQSMVKQHDEQICQHAVLTALDLMEMPELAQDFVATTETRQLIVKLLSRARQATENALYPQVEDLLGPRVQLVDKALLIPSSGKLKDTTVFTDLIDVWDDYDFYYYGNIRVTNESELKAVIKEDIKRTTNKPAVGGSASSPPGKLMRRASQFFRKEDRVDPAPLDEPTTQQHSPLDRRRSTVNAKLSTTEDKPSPLDRRRSSIHPGHSHSRQPSGGEKDGEPRGGFSLIRRASNLFEKMYTSRGNNAAGVHGAGGTVAFARRQSMIKTESSSISRRGSIFKKKSSEEKIRAAVSCAANQPLARRASMMQRRASAVGVEGGPAAFDRKLYSKLDRRLHNEADSKDDESSDDDSEFSLRNWRSFEESENGDDDTFVPKMLEYVMTALRHALSPELYKVFFEKNIAIRLVGLLSDPETSPCCLPDILYMIGVTARFQNLADQYGTYQTIDRILSLIRRAYKKQGAIVAEATTNGCLALANLVLLHVPNTKRLAKRRGEELIADVIRVRGDSQDYKSVNGAAALVCNMCYKNEEMKVLSGQKGICQALVHAMRVYEASVTLPPTDTEPAKNDQISMSSVFRAVGNLALSDKNMTIFLAAGIENAYCCFLGEADESLDTNSLEACFRTLANLLIEKDHMEIFSVVVIPLLSLLRKERHKSAEVHRWAFMALANLCRLPENAQEFCKNEGIGTVRMLIPFLEESGMLTISVIWLLGIQTTYTPNIQILLDNGIFEVLANTLEMYCAEVQAREEKGPSKPFTPSELRKLPIVTLACAHRMLKDNSTNSAKECLDSGVFEMALKILSKSSRDNSSPMLTYEALRLVFGTLALYSNSDGLLDCLKTSVESVDTVDQTEITMQFNRLQQGFNPVSGLQPEYFDPCADKESSAPQLGPHVCLSEGEFRFRSWYQMKMGNYLAEIVMNLRRIVSDESSVNNIRLQKLAIGMLNLAATENICLSSLFANLDDNLHSSNKPSQRNLQRKKSIWDRISRKAAENVDSKAGDSSRSITRVSMVVDQCIRKYSSHRDLVLQACILLNASVYLCYGSECYRTQLLDTHLLQNLNAYLKNHPKGDHYISLSVENYRRFLQTEGKIRESDKVGFGPHDLNMMCKLKLTSFPYSLTEWDVDPFPDGVMSLKPETREFLRRGGSALIIDSLGNKAQFLWKASHDLISLEWKTLPLKTKLDSIAIDPTFPFSVAASTITKATPGTGHRFFTVHSAQGSKIHESRSCWITAPPLPHADYSDGVSLCLEFREQSSRDFLLSTLNSWRESSAFGFL